MAMTSCQQRSQRPGAAGRAGGAEGRTGGGQIHVAGDLQVAERHAQQDRRSRASSGSARSSSTRPRARSRPITRRSSPRRITAPRPIEYVLVGLASCLTAGVAAVAQNRGIQLRSVESKLEGKMDIRGILGIDSDVRNGYDDIKVTFKIDADASKQDIEAIVAQSQKRSAVYDIITNPMNVTVEVAVTATRPSGAIIERVTTVVIGAGHAGLAASRCLSERSIDHVVLERGEVANSWRRERWDSLRLLTPNWQSRLPGYRYDGADPDGYMTMAEVIDFISRFAVVVRRAGTHAHDGHLGEARRTRGYHVATDRGDLRCRMRGAGERRLQRPERAGASTGRARRPSRASPRSTTATRTSCRTAACWSSARRPPACSSPTKSTAPAGR